MHIYVYIMVKCCVLMSQAARFVYVRWLSPRHECVPNIVVASLFGFLKRREPLAPKTFVLSVYCCAAPGTGSWRCLVMFLQWARRIEIGSRLAGLCFNLKQIMQIVWSLKKQMFIFCRKKHLPCFNCLLLWLWGVEHARLSVYSMQLNSFILLPATICCKLAEQLDEEALSSNICSKRIKVFLMHPTICCKLWAHARASSWCCMPEQALPIFGVPAALWIRVNRCNADLHHSRPFFNKKSRRAEQTK